MSSFFQRKKPVEKPSVLKELGTSHVDVLSKIVELLGVDFVFDASQSVESLLCQLEAVFPFFALKAPDLAWDIMTRYKRTHDTQSLHDRVSRSDFNRIAPLLRPVCDVVTANGLFDALSGPGVEFLTRETFISFVLALESKLYATHCAKADGRRAVCKIPAGETVLCLSGKRRAPVMANLQQKVIAAPGRLVLTDSSLYYDEAFSLKKRTGGLSFKIADTQISASNSGPLGAKIFDNGLSATRTGEETVFAFQQLGGTSTRNKWLLMIAELAAVHKLIGKNNIPPAGAAKLISYARINIIRAQALWDCVGETCDVSFTLPFSCVPSNSNGSKVLASLLSFLQIPIDFPATAHTTTPTKFSPEFRYLSSFAKKSEKAVEIDVSKLRLVFDLRRFTVIDSAYLELQRNSEQLATIINQIKSAEEAETRNQFAIADGLKPSFILLFALLNPIFTSVGDVWRLLQWENTFQSSAALLFLIYLAWIDRINLLPIILSLWPPLSLLYSKAHPRLDPIVIRIAPTKPHEIIQQIIGAVSKMQAGVQYLNQQLLKLHFLFTHPTHQSDHLLIASISLVILVAIVVHIPFRLLFIIGVMAAFLPRSPFAVLLSPNKRKNKRAETLLAEWWQRVPPTQVLQEDA